MLKIKMLMAAGLAPGTIVIRVGDCYSEINILQENNQNNSCSSAAMPAFCRDAGIATSHPHDALQMPIIPSVFSCADHHMPEAAPVRFFTVP
jgi:hypothetical protein